MRSRISEEVKKDHYESTGIHETQRGNVNMTMRRNAKKSKFLVATVFMFLVLLLLIIMVLTPNMQPVVVEINNIIDIDAAPSENEYPNAARGRIDGDQDNSGNLTVSSAMKLHNGQNISIAFVTFSHLSNITQFENTILASANTWVPPESTYYVVLNQMWENKFTQWKKQKIENFRSIQINGTSATESIVGIHRIQPIYVDCPEGKFGESPCCKQEQGLVNFHKMHYYDKQSRKAKYDWIFFSDDDIYILPTALEKFIHFLPFGLPKHKKMIELQLKNEEPLILVQSLSYFLGQYGYQKATSLYSCSRDNEFKYPWGQPVVYNRAALERILPGLQQNGLVKQCMEYGVTHDVGNAILHWMYSIPSVKFWFPNAKHQLTWRKRNKSWKFRGDSIGYHGAGAHESLKMEWFHEETKHERRMIETMSNAPFDRNQLPSEHYFDWRMVNGFNQTTTFEKYGDPGKWIEWHTMPASDCKGVSIDDQKS